MASTTTTIDPTTQAINEALKAAKIDPKYSAPDASSIAQFQAHFVPGIDDEYVKYFDALINAAKAQYGTTSQEAGHYIALKTAWEQWRTKNLGLSEVDLSKSGGKTAQDLINQANAVRQVLKQQTSKINSETAAYSNTAKDLAAANTALYGKNGKAEAPAKGSIAKQYADYKAQLNDPKKAAAAQQKLYGKNRDENNPATGSIAYLYNEAANKQKAIADNASAKVPLSDIVHLSLDDYVNKAYTPYSNFLSGAPVPKEGEDPNAFKVNQYLEAYKKTGAVPNDVDSALLGQVQKAISDYEQGKLKVSKEAADKLAAQNAEAISKTRSDISSYNQLLDEARKKAPVVAPSTSTLLNQLQANKAALGTQSSTTPAAGTQPPAGPKFTPPPKLGLNLSNDFNTRMIQQDLAAQQQLQNPGTYATGQFDPFYSGFLNSASQFSTQPSTMNPNGTFSGGALYRPNTGVGFGFQNAYDASAPTGAAAVTGAAAGGYMDAQSVGQNNQALQNNNNQLGLGSIPNMSQYTNYTGNPGITSPTQNTDDGGIGGVSVLGQTNPVW